MSLTTFSSCVGAVRVETVLVRREACFGLVLTLTLAFSLFFYGHCEVLRERGSPADFTTASRTCPR